MTVVSENDVASPDDLERDVVAWLDHGRPGRARAARPAAPANDNDVVFHGDEAPAPVWRARFRTVE